MKIKVFGIIFISFILVMLVNGAGSAIGESLKYHVAKSIFSQANGSKKITISSREDINKSLFSSEFIEKYKDAAKNTSPKYYWYFGILFLVQVILIIGIAMVASFITINIVKRGVKLE